jgi:hypothetical protein
MGLNPTFRFDGETMLDCNPYKNDRYTKKRERGI